MLIHICISFFILVNINKSLNLKKLYLLLYIGAVEALFFCGRDISRLRSLLVCLDLFICIVIVIMWVHFLFTFLD